jgi:hypothetical protein
MIGKDAFIENGPFLTRSVLSAFPYLVLNRDRRLPIATKSGIDGAAKDHSVTSAEGLFVSDSVTDP